MTPAEASQRFEEGLLAFVHCNHGSGMEPSPCSVQASKIAVTIYCALCLREKVEDEIWWLTPEQAAEQHGWHVRADEAPEPVAGRVHGVDAMNRRLS